MSPVTELSVPYLSLPGTSLAFPAAVGNRKAKPQVRRLRPLQLLINPDEAVLVAPHDGGVAVAASADLLGRLQFGYLLATKVRSG